MYAWLYVLLYTIVDFISSLEFVLYVWFISTLNKALNWIKKIITLLWVETRLTLWKNTKIKKEILQKSFKRLEYILQITFLLCLLVVFELSVDIPMDTNYAPFPADYSFISMKRTTDKRITPVVEAITVSLKKFFLCLQNRPLGQYCWMCRTNKSIWLLFI